MQKIKRLRQLIHYKPIQRAFFVFLIAFSVTQYIASGIYAVEKRNEHLLVRQEAVHIRNRLQSALNHSVTATKTLSFLVERDMLGVYFDQIAEELLNHHHYIDAIQLVRGHTIIATYPIEGNESTIGYTVMENASHRMEAMKALDRMGLYFEGPFELKQGGMGFVGRYPVFKGDTLWGFSAVVIRMPTFLKAMGINDSGKNETFTYQLLKYPDNASAERSIFPGNHIGREGVVYKTVIPFGDWYLYVKLNKSRYLFKAMRFATIGSLLSLLMAVFVWYLSVQPLKLRKQVLEKTRDLDHANRKLEARARELLASNKELEQFAYVASHDLQEPLRMITGFLNRIEQKYDDQLDEKGRLYIHFAVDGAVRMRQVILDLLRFSRLTNVQDTARETIDLNELIRNYLVLRQQLIAEKGALIVVDELPEISGYKAPVIQIFNNLLDNALKYHRPDVPPVIRVGVSETGEYYEFFVKDNGIGIEKEYFEKIFIIFQRLHDKSEFEGSGIGLAIVSKLVKGMGGTVRVESVQGEGSTFYFTLNK